MIGALALILMAILAGAQVSFNQGEPAPLPEGCPDQIGGEQLENYVTRASGALIQRARSQGDQCVNRTAKAFTYHVAAQQRLSCNTANCSPWNQNFLGSCTAGTSSQACEEARALQIQQRENLRRFIVSSLATSDPAPEEVDRLCLLLTPENPLDLIRRAGIDEVVRELDCMELPAGASRSIRTRVHEQSTVYKLTRIDSQSYRLGVPVHFQADPSVSPQQLGEFQNRIQSCLDGYSPTLLGPNGERLSIQITSAPPGADSNSIVVSERVSRMNSRNYSLGIECSTVLHEVLHLTGLVDEYRERDQSRGYGCRIVPNRTSIMGNDVAAADALASQINCTVQPQFQAIWSASSEQERSLLLRPQLGEILNRADFCVPRPESERLSLAEALTRGSLPLRELDRGENHLSFEAYVPVVDTESAEAWIEKRTVDCRCPPGTHSKCHAWLNNPPTRNINLTGNRENCPSIMIGETRPISPSGNSTELTATGMVIRREGQIPSLLSPGQFNRILSGRCQRRSQDYNICASWAYVSECGPRQSTCFDRPGICSGPPAQCTSERYLGTVQAQ